VGFVPIYEPTNPWGIINTNEMITEARRRGYKLVYSAFTGSIAAQTAQMQALIDARVDAIILRPMDAAALAPSVVAARKACIPVFTENRFLDPTRATPGADYVTGIGADPMLQGQTVADWLVHAMHEKATIIEIEGTQGSSSAIGRKRGFDERIAGHPAMRVVASHSGGFLWSEGHDVAKKLLAAYPSANVIYSHGDIMALGAVAAVREIGRVPGKDVIIVSIDGLREAVQDVAEGTIAAVEFNDPRLAGQAFDAMAKYAAGEPIAPSVIVEGHMIDKTNVATEIAKSF
jgi:ribose transport system substrate-binding protein